MGVVQNNQTIIDLTIQKCGSVESLFDFALLNETSITEVPVPGTKYEAPEPHNKTITDYFERKGISIGTSPPIKYILFEEGLFETGLFE